MAGTREIEFSDSTGTIRPGFLVAVRSSDARGAPSKIALVWVAENGTWTAVDNVVPGSTPSTWRWPGA